MSSESRIEPDFDNIKRSHTDDFPTLNSGNPNAPKTSDPFLLEDEPEIDAAAMLMRSGIVIALILATFGGYKFYQGGTLHNQFASQTRTDWAGRPLATNGHGDVVWSDGKSLRNIDLTTTASVKADPKLRIVEAKTDKADHQISPNAKYHIIESGDTLSAIARAYKVKTADIMEINKIENPRSIKPGMKIYLTR